MKNFRNELYSFEIEIPEEWSLYTGIVANSSLGKDQTLTFNCRRNEAVNIKIAPLMLIPFLYQIESEFRQYAQEQGYTSLELGRFKADGEEHVWVRCYEGDGRWSKQYRIVLHGFEYMITAKCMDERLLLEMEKDWDVIASSFSLIKKPDAIAEKSAPEREAQDGRFIKNNMGEKVISKDNLEGVKTYKNDELGFEVDMPARWIVPPASTHQPPFDESIIIGCGPNEAFNFQIGPLLQVPTLDFTEREFIEFAQNSKYSDLEFGRINVEGKLHIWARYYMGRGAWTKKYLIVLGGFEYAITATCFDLQEFKKREKVWDEVVGSFRLSRSKKQDMTEINRHRREVAGKLYEEAYETVASERYSEARSLLEQCLCSDPDHILAHKELAVVLKKLGDIKGALAHRREVKRLDPSDTVNRYNLADLLVTLGEKDAAMQEIKEFQAIEPAKINKSIRFQMGMKHIFQAISLRERKSGSRVESLVNAIHQFQQALELLTRQDFPKEWLSIHIELGETCRHLSLIKDLDDNLLQAIFHYEQVLEVATRSEYPELWAAAHNNLGIAYANGTRGEVTENVEKAISHCQQALEFYTRNTHPDDWAMTQNNLGNAYRRRVKGNRAENIELAIFCFHQALEVQDHQVDREQWAGTHNNLTFAYHERLKGEPAENLEKIIFHAQQALEVYTFETHPRDWALTHNRLGATYKDRICGDRADNLEQAIHHVELALEVLNRQTDPEDWAKGQTILGLAYQDRQRGERADNVEQAISYFLQALQVFTKLAFPSNWVAIQNYLAFAYQDRMRGSHTDNLERSIDYFQQALEVCTRQEYPEQWAVIHNSLALAYIKRQKGDRSKNYDQALYHCQQQLDVFTRQSYPEKWAMAQFFLGTITIDRKRGDRSEYTEQAFHYFQQALEVFTRERYPGEWARVQEGLALVDKERSLGSKGIKSDSANLSFGLTYSELYDEISKQHGDRKRHLKLIYEDVPEIKYATNLLLVYQWEGELTEDEVKKLNLRAAIYLACAIYDAARSVGVPCAISPIQNGQRPAWMIQGESSPVSLTLSDIGMSDRTLQMSIGPMVVSLSRLPVNKVLLRELMEGFRKHFTDIYV